MKKEIRGLKVGDYWSEDKSTLLRVRCSDEGVIVEIADTVVDMFYAFTVDPNKHTHKFEWGQVSPHITEGDKDGAS